MGLVARPVVEHKGYGMRERERERERELCAAADSPDASGHEPTRA
jgi:hypothetical protein